MNGIPPEITDRAENLARLAARGEDLLSACAVMSETEIAELQNGVSLVIHGTFYFFPCLFCFEISSPYSGRALYVHHHAFWKFF